MIEYFEIIFNKYKIKYNNSNPNPNINIDINTSFTSINSINNIDYSSDDEFFKSTNTNLENKDEIEIYLEEDIISKEIDIIDYYKANKERFPIIYNIVKDYLAISPSSAPSESTFSKVGDIITKKRNRLLPSTVKQLITL